MEDIKTHIFDHFYEQYLVLLTMVPRISIDVRKYQKHTSCRLLTTLSYFTVGANPRAQLEDHQVIYTGTR